MKQDFGITSDAESRKRLVRGGRLHGVHWLVIVLSIVLTVAAWYISSQQVLQKNLIEFNRQADHIIELVEERMNLYENALWGGVALIDANGGDVSYARWLDYARSLRIDEVYPGINGIGVIFNIQPPQLAGFLAEERRDRPDFALHPEHDQTEYWPITYIEPAAPNALAVGLDMAFETNRYSSVRKARDLGEAQMTGPITLVQDARRTPGFLLYTPFYRGGTRPDTTVARRAGIVGVTYAPFIMSKLMQGTLASENRQVRIRISDDSVLLFDDEDEGNSADRDRDPLFAKMANIEMYGRTWTFDIQSSRGFRVASSNNQPYWILVGALVIDTLLLGLFIFLTRINRTALAYADRMTLALEEKSMRLQKSNQDLEQFAYVASHDLKSPLRGIDTLAQFIAEDLEDRLDDESRTNFGLLRRRVARMEKLLDDLLEYSRAGRRHTKIADVDLRELLADTVALASAPNGFTIDVGGDLDTVHIARAALQQVILNIIGNALKHHDRDQGKVTIDVRNHGGHLAVTIADDGPGIAKEFHDRIFKMFHTLRPRDDVEGSGMGLAIVKKLVDANGGSVSVMPMEGRGATFNIKWLIAMGDTT